MSPAICSLLAEMAAAFAAENRPEATETANALIGASFAAHPTLTDQDTNAIRALLFTSSHPCAPAMAAAHDALPWGVNPVARKVRPEHDDIYAVCDLMGPESPVRSDHLRAGLYYQRPNRRYALHSHAAEETYIIIAGSTLWTAGDTRKLLGPGDAVHHSTYMPHACQTGPDGVIALWRWNGDIGTDSYRIHDGHDAFAA